MDESKHRWFCPAPSWLVYASLLATVLLFLSELWRWFPFNAHKGWTVLLAVAGVGVVLAAMLVWFAVALIFRWRFQFSIRTLLMLVVAVALPCSWLAVAMKEARKQTEVVAEIRKSHGRVVYDWQLDATPVWLREDLGCDLFSEVVEVVVRRDADLEQLKLLPQLRRISTGIQPQFTDTGLSHLKEVKQIRELALYGPGITDATLEHLKELAQLQDLTLLNTRTTDRAVKKLQQALPNCTIYHVPWWL